jgi:hypothetical protein
MSEPDGKRNQAFTATLEKQLENLVYRIDSQDHESQKKLLERRMPAFEKILLILPALVGWLLNSLLYIPLRSFTIKKASNNDHYDSILTSLVVFLYPLYVIVFTLVLYLVTENLFVLLLILILPFTAWAFVRLKPQLDRNSK